MKFHLMIIKEKSLVTLELYLKMKETTVWCLLTALSLLVTEDDWKIEKEEGLCLHLLCFSV